MSRSQGAQPEWLTERRARLWPVALPPAIWAVHFLASYLTAAVWCAKLSDRAGTLAGARWAIAGYTAVALLMIGACAWRALRMHNFGNEPLPHDEATAGDRHRFLGFATLLLSGLSAVAVLFTALPAAIFSGCQ